MVRVFDTNINKNGKMITPPVWTLFDKCFYRAIGDEEKVRSIVEDLLDDGSIRVGKSFVGI